MRNLTEEEIVEAITAEVCVHCPIRWPVLVLQGVAYESLPKECVLIEFAMAYERRARTEAIVSSLVGALRMGVNHSWTRSSRGRQRTK